MKKLFSTLFMVAIVAVLCLGVFQSTASAITWCDDSCCPGAYECRPTATLCYCPGTLDVTNCYSFCEGLCTVTECLW